MFEGRASEFSTVNQQEYQSPITLNAGRRIDDGLDYRFADLDLIAALRAGWEASLLRKRHA